MHLRWSQILLDIHSRRSSKLFLSSSRRQPILNPLGQNDQYSGSRIPDCTTIAQPFPIEIRLSPPGRRRTSSLAPPPTSIIRCSAGRYGSWRPRSIAPNEEAKLNSLTSHFQRSSFSDVTKGRRRRMASEEVDRVATGAARESFHFQFITTPTSDTPGTSILLHFNSRRYIFGNVSEGTQRACVQRGIGLRKVRDIFLTGQMKWQNTGGVIGFILTLAGVQTAAKRDPEVVISVAGTPRVNRPHKQGPSAEKIDIPSESTITIHGGEQLMHTIACARTFVFRKGMPVSINEIECSDNSNLEEPTWKDENIRIWSLLSRLQRARKLAPMTPLTGFKKVELPRCRLSRLGGSGGERAMISLSRGAKAREIQ